MAQTVDEFVVRQKKVLLELVIVVCEGFTYDPGHSDLDDEQPIHVRMTLGDYRKAVAIVRESAWMDNVINSA